MGFGDMGFTCWANCNIVEMQIAREMVMVVNLREVAAALVMQLLSSRLLPIGMGTTQMGHGILPLLTTALHKSASLTYRCLFVEESKCH